MDTNSPRPKGRDSVLVERGHWDEQGLECTPETRGQERGNVTWHGQGKSFHVLFPLRKPVWAGLRRDRRWVVGGGRKRWRWRDITALLYLDRASRLGLDECLRNHHDCIMMSKTNFPAS